jgi:hypothetical protein
VCGRGRGRLRHRATERRFLPCGRLRPPLQTLDSPSLPQNVPRRKPTNTSGMKTVRDFPTFTCGHVGNDSIPLTLNKPVQTPVYHPKLSETRRSRSGRSNRTHDRCSSSERRSGSENRRCKRCGGLSYMATRVAIDCPTAGSVGKTN